MLLGVTEELISMKQEGTYWDFKREWHKNNADLLHDIICMANNLEDRDAYIIIGIDEGNDFETISIVNDSNLKTTQNITDFLSGKSFSGEIRPQVYVKNINISNNMLDVIVIKNNYYTPFFLTQDYKGVKPHHIYTRVMDTNTPRNKSADIHHIEYLWKKRFRLNSSPLERVKYYLENQSDWLVSPNGFELLKNTIKIFRSFLLNTLLKIVEMHSNIIFLTNQIIDHIGEKFTYFTIKH